MNRLSNCSHFILAITKYIHQNDLERTFYYHLQSNIHHTNILPINIYASHVLLLSLNIELFAELLVI